MRSLSAATWWAALVWAIAGCSGGIDQTPIQPAQTPLPLVSASAGPTVGNNLMLYVSNQSFHDDPVHIEVTIDGVTIVDRAFEVGGQHNWVTFPLSLPPGTHELRAVSDTGVELVQPVSIPATGIRYAVMDYWYHPDEPPRHFDFHISDEPVGFG